MPQRSESLKMLDSEEGQLNAVFACFGFAAQYAQLFEAGLVRFLIVYNKISAESLTLEDFETIESNLQKRTMGQLIRELSRYVNFQDLALAGHFDDALQKRNFLMHRFFLAR
ncbi:MAG TPA: hypothetical protein VFZ99_05985, partial [Terriglobales bacterium]